MAAAKKKVSVTESAIVNGMTRYLEGKVEGIMQKLLPQGWEKILEQEIADRLESSGLLPMSQRTEAKAAVAEATPVSSTAEIPVPPVPEMKLPLPVPAVPEEMDFSKLLEGI